MTATNRLMSQKLRTMTQMMKNKAETKNSASMIEYIKGDHYQKTNQCHPEHLAGNIHTPLAEAVIITWRAA
jgi:hypothetical protein